MRKLVKLEFDLKNAQDDELLEVCQVGKDVAEFRKEFKRHWPKYTIQPGSLGTLPAEPWLVKGLVARKAVEEAQASLTKSWASEMQPWKDLIDTIKKCGESIIAVNELAEFKVKLKSLLTDLLKSLDGRLRATWRPGRGAGRFACGQRTPLVRAAHGRVLEWLKRKCSSDLPDQHRETLPLLFVQHVEHTLRMEPLVWLIPLPRQTPTSEEWSAEQYACGLICVLPQSPTCSEILVWVRRPVPQPGHWSTVLRETARSNPGETEADFPTGLSRQRPGQRRIQALDRLPERQLARQPRKAGACHVAEFLFRLRISPPEADERQAGSGPGPGAPLRWRSQVNRHAVLKPATAKGGPMNTCDDKPSPKGTLLALVQYPVMVGLFIWVSCAAERLGPRPRSPNHSRCPSWPCSLPSPRTKSRHCLRRPATTCMMGRPTSRKVSFVISISSSAILCFFWPWLFFLQVASAAGRGGLRRRSWVALWGLRWRMLQKTCSASRFCAPGTGISVPSRPPAFGGLQQVGSSFAVTALLGLLPTARPAVFNLWVNHTPGRKRAQLYRYPEPIGGNCLCRLDQPIAF